MVSHLPNHVLIVGLDYAPDSFGIAPYTTGLAESIAANGTLVDVICGMPYYPEWQVRIGFQRKLRSKETRNSVYSSTVLCSALPLTFSNLLSLALLMEEFEN